MECCFNGAVPNREVYRFYAETPVSLFVNVSSGEGLPVSIMEAASFGIPAVATDVGGTSEIVADALTGRLLKPDFSDADLAAAIADFAAMPAAAYAQMRERTREAWQAKFNSAVNYVIFSALIAGDGIDNIRPGE
ncbi:MAG: UDP-D-galactose:(glucosyl)lipopolysaccharide-1,6-D-galactosyltransferase [Firmicutes bacterium ADurb.Bin262]|nr:MAG: UDP-D-galactose:(glucosyl)lipopolysaccharide-1,6-D-galactosyltransferase [Firmicutes bacterium ADurb.Bin262]